MGRDLSESNASEKELELFLTYLFKLKFVELTGVCELVGSTIYNYNEEGVAKEFKPLEEIVENCIDGFCFMSRKDRRKLLKILKKEVKGK